VTASSRKLKKNAVADDKEMKLNRNFVFFRKTVF